MGKKVFPTPLSALDFYPFFFFYDDVSLCFLIYFPRHKWGMRCRKKKESPAPKWQILFHFLILRYRKRDYFRLWKKKDKLFFSFALFSEVVSVLIDKKIVSEIAEVWICHHIQKMKLFWNRLWYWIQGCCVTLAIAFVRMFEKRKWSGDLFEIRFYLISVWLGRMKIWWKF